MKSSTSSILTISNSLKGSILFEYLKLPMPLAGWETVNNHKPESKTPIQYTNAHIWNLERW